MRFKKIYVEITNTCNLQCSFCIQNKRPSKTVSISEFEYILQQIKPYTNYIYLHVMGEPLAHPHLDQILSLCEEYAIQVNITTNGTLLKKQLPILLTHAIRQINISLHNFKEIPSISTSQYLNDMFACAEQLIEHKIYISYRLWSLKNSMLDNDTQSLLLELQQHYHIVINENDIVSHKNIKLKQRLFLNFEEIFTWPSMDHQLISNRGSCLGLKTMCGILSDGTVVPCCLDSKGDCSLGNVYQTPFAQILAGEKMQDIQEGFQNQQIKAELCKRCSFRNRFDI